MQVDFNAIQAVKILGAYTAGRYDIWALSGSSRASCRAHVMSVLMGSKMPQSKSGVTAIRAEFYSRLQIQDGTLADREDRFFDTCRMLTA